MVGSMKTRGKTAVMAKSATAQSHSTHDPAIDMVAPPPLTTVPPTGPAAGSSNLPTRDDNSWRNLRKLNPPICLTGRATKEVNFFKSTRKSTIPVRVANEDVEKLVNNRLRNLKIGGNFKDALEGSQPSKLYPFHRRDRADPP
ncbi:unnamed protein product, partial [Prunus brigantina]